MEEDRGTKANIVYILAFFFLLRIIRAICMCFGLVLRAIKCDKKPGVKMPDVCVWV